MCYWKDRQYRRKGRKCCSQFQNNFFAWKKLKREIAGYHYFTPSPFFPPKLFFSESIMNTGLLDNVLKQERFSVPVHWLYIL